MINMLLIHSVNSILLLTQMIMVNNAEPNQSLKSRTGPEDLIGGLIDHLTCSRTTNRGYKGRCVPRSCCANALGVRELCTDPQYTCCYGGDRCTNGAHTSGALNEFDQLVTNGDRLRKFALILY